MDSIALLEPRSRDQFLYPATRIIHASVLLHRNYHEHPVKPDLLAEYEGIAAWNTVTCCYSGIEQAMKCLLKMAGHYRESRHRHHHIGKLFKALVAEEQRVIGVSYAKYKSLHDYIPLHNVGSFLDAIDEGYQYWRYFLLEGPEEGRWPPTTHAGAMLEIWSALTDILQARIVTNHGLHTVDRRLVHYLQDKTTHEALTRHALFGNGTAEEEDLNRWYQAYNNVAINAYADLFYRYKKDELHLLKISSATLIALQTLIDIVRYEVEKEKVDNDICTFVWRAESGTIKWNTQTGLFENPLK